MDDLEPEPRTLLVLTLGGTIAMTHSESGPAGVTPTLSGSDLVAAVPALRDVAEITVEDFRRVPGASLSIGDIVSLVERLTEADTEGVHGIVITQGTDTLEETAYLADLYYRGGAPVVFTGAMRNAAAEGADGPANILAAARTAAAGNTRGLGVLVVLGDEIHAARHVRKMHTLSTTAFASPETGPIGYLVEGTPRIRSSLEPTQPVPLPVTPVPRVALVTATLGSDDFLLEGLENKVAGLVIAAFGAGHVPESWCARIEALADMMPVVLTSRIGIGPVLSSTYAFPGSESDLLRRGLISGGPLDPYKARLLLSAHLAAGSSRTEIEKAFATRH